MNLLKKSKVLLMLGIAVTAVLTFYGCSRTKKIDLNKYVTIETEGYDTVGEAHFYFDLNQFEEDYAGKIKLTENNKGSVNGLWESDGKQSVEQMLLNDCVKDIYFDKDTELNNGDEITLSMDINNTIATEYYNVELSFEDITYKVDNLKQPKEFNPFDYIDVSFSGASPRVIFEIEANYDIPEMNDIEIFWESERQNGKLANGDQVKVTVSGYHRDSYFAETYGEVISEKERIYTVENLPEYVTEASDIPADLYDKMNEKLLEYFNSYAAQKWEDSVNADLEYVGTYLLNVKPDAAEQYRNRLYLIYKVNYSNKYTSDFTYYWFGEFTNVKKNPDGSIDVDLDDYMYCEATDGFFSTTGDFLSVDSYGYWVAGFNNLEEFENSKIVPKEEAYTVKKNVQ